MNNQRQSLRIHLTLLLACFAAPGCAALSAEEKPEAQVDVLWSGVGQGCEHRTGNFLSRLRASKLSGDSDCEV